MKILVTTPGGRIGRAVLGELLAPEFSVRVIAREPSRLPADIREQIELVRGSTDDAETLRSALEGIESLFWCVPRPSSGETDLRRHYERFSLAACQALRAARTPRVVAISCGGLESGLQARPTSLLHIPEDILNKSGAAIRHLRCSAGMADINGWEKPISDGGLAVYPASRNGQSQKVAVRDIADVALRWLVRRDWEGIATVPVTGGGKLAYQAQGALA